MSTKTVAAPRHHTHGLSGFGFWLHQHQRVFDVTGIVLLGVCGLSVLVQLVYPADYALPFMRVGGLDVGLQDRTTIAAALNDYAQKGEVTIVSPSKQWRTSWQEIGLAVDAEATTDAALHYATWERLIPFSSVIRVAQAKDQPMVALVDNEQLQAFAEQLVAEDKLAAQDAMIRVRDGQVVVDEAKNGYVFEAQDVRQQVQSLAMGEGATLNLVARPVPFARPASELSEVKSQAQGVLGHRIALKLGDRQYTPSNSDVGGWLVFNEDPATKEIRMTIDTESIRRYLLDVDKQEGFERGVSTVTLLDGIEIDRTPAPGGKTVATSEMVAAIMGAVTSGTTESTITLQTADVGPDLSYVRTYSQSDQGLQAVIEAWKVDNPGNNAILVRELTGQRRYAAINPDKVFVPASTFKIWVFYVVAQKITSGEISYNTRTDMGWTVEDCLEEMIVRSTNPCAISFMNMIGWQQTEDMVHAAGFTNTYMNNYGGGDKTTTTRDETAFMTRLYHGNLMAEEPTQRLLGYMKRQIWRTGVPAGVPKGVVVANKVGRYNGWVHDIAIVYGSKSDYVLGVMSRGQNWKLFSDLARRVHGFLQN